MRDKHPGQSCDVNINEDICGKNSEIICNILCTQFPWFITNLYLACKHRQSDDKLPLVNFRLGQIVHFHTPLPQQKGLEFPERGSLQPKKLKQMYEANN